MTGRPSPLTTGLRSKCPACGRGALFRGFLTVLPCCSVCNTDFTKMDSADGPAVFVVLIAGAIVVTAALVVEVKYQPPYWLHAALWLPLIIGLSLGLLRPLKALMIALQYRHKAGNGQIDDT
ncbi:MAG: DUF983 domain-containing protein [Alphaproteobacteria bacterium]